METKALDTDSLRQTHTEIQARQNVDAYLGIPRHENSDADTEAHGDRCTETCIQEAKPETKRLGH